MLDEVSSGGSRLWKVNESESLAATAGGICVCYIGQASVARFNGEDPDQHEDGINDRGGLTHIDSVAYQIL